MLTLVASTASAAPSFQNGEAIMQAVYEQSRHDKNQRAAVELIIDNGSGKQRVRHFRMWHKIFPERTKSLMKFHKPASIQGTGLLNETLNGADKATQWIYLPALRSVKQLNAEEQNNSFMGSDFTNGDIAGRQVSRDKHHFSNEDEKKFYITSHPKDDDDLYSKIEVEVLRSIMVPARVIFYDRDGRKLKTLFNARISKVKNMYVVTEAVMTNHQNGSSTTLKKHSIDHNSNIPESRVGLRGLQG